MFGAGSVPEVTPRDLSRCVVCRRIVTLRRIQAFGNCKCGSRKVMDFGALTTDDALEIEDDYGWDIILRGFHDGQLSEGLLAAARRTGAHEGKTYWALDEARLHSRVVSEARRVRARERQLHARERILLGLPIPRDYWDPRKWRDLLRSFRGTQVRGADVGEGNP